MKDFKELASMRQSCRAYQATPVPEEALRSMIETARLAPSACNSQPWHFTVVTGKHAEAVGLATRKGGANGFTETVPAFIVISEGKATLSARVAGILQSQHFAQMDLGIATAHLCFAALDEGLSTCILGWFDEKKLIEAAALPKGLTPRLVLAVGYAENDLIREKKRNSMEGIASFLS